MSDGTWTYTWEHGRELTSMTSSDTTATYSYNADGLRIKKTVDGVVHNYVYSGGKLVEETYGDTKLNFSYDANGNPYTFSYTKGDNSPSVYHYVLNLQGDVVRIVTNKGVTRVTYEYDAWGNITNMEYTNETLANANPLRYRGYYYDRETGLYYLQSRYYNPEIGRWLNADKQVSSVGGDIRGYNLFSYCFNNPVNMIDPTGNWPSWGQVLTAVATVAVAAVFVTAVVASAGAVGVATGIAAASIGATGAMVGTAITAGTVGTYVVATGIGVCAASNAGEILTGTNIVRDGLMGGNQEAYDTVQTALNIAGGGAIIISQTHPVVTGDAAKPKQDAQVIHKVPPTGSPITSFDKLYSGKPGEFQRTYYDFRGNMSAQLDFTVHTPDSGHTFPHFHYFVSGCRETINFWWLE